MEVFDIVDELGNPTGETVVREEAHLLGIRHRTSHVWLLRVKNGALQVLLQKRSMKKDSFPGCYDISSAGHIPAGNTWVPSALRELEEELGLKMEENDLHEAGIRSVFWQGEFGGKPFLDREVSKVFYVWWDGEPEDLTFRDGEVEAALWMDMELCIRETREGSLKNCIYPEELEMVLFSVKTENKP